ncbi:cold-shock protein [Secundilactobacillus kimchicus]|uniref:cold-shock protein n=1 Tax=Secundilactobacillus kimchicus TaxID=528209 RepID=UPI000B05AFFA
MLLRVITKKNGYGFITSDDGENLFVHYTGIEGAGFKTLTAGQKVRFVVVEGAKGPKQSRLPW